MASQLSIPLAIPFPVAAPQRILLPSPEDQQQAESSLAVLQMLFDFQKKPDRFGRLQLSDGTPVTSFSRMVAYAAATTENSERTLLRWLAEYRKGGLAALADRKRKDKNSSRFFEAYPKAKILAAYLFLECRQSVTVCFEALIRDAALIEVPEDDLPS